MLRRVANDVLRNDVMLRINDVALRANGISPSTLAKHRKLCYNNEKVNDYMNKYSDHHCVFGQGSRSEPLLGTFSKKFRQIIKST